MNLIDGLLLLIIIISVISGFQKGFLSGALSLLLLAGGLIFAFTSYKYLAGFFEKYVTSLGVWTFPVAFIIAYFFARIILALIARLILGELPERSQDHGFNKFLGVIPGVINGLLYAAIFSALLLGLPLFDGLSAKTRESTIANNLLPHVEWAEDKLAPVFDKAINRSINNLSVEPTSEKTIKLHFSVKNPKVREDLEIKMLELVNTERAKVGLPALKPDNEMREVARAHSVDMFARSYFSHINPEGKSPGDRARQAGVQFLTAGENLALGQTLKIAHTGLMNSPGHRANILDPGYGRVGIGVLDGGMHGLMITQNFRN